MFVCAVCIGQGDRDANVICTYAEMHACLGLLDLRHPIECMQCRTAKPVCVAVGRDASATCTKVSIV